MKANTVIVTGSSDDLVCLEGFIRDEFTPKHVEQESLLRFNDGTTLAIHYDSDGCWRIRPIVIGQDSMIEHVPADGPDEDRYYDTLTLTGPFNNVQFINN